MFSKKLRVIAAVALGFFSWTSAGVFSFAHAAQAVVKEEKAKAPLKEKADGAAERFGKATEEIGAVLADPKMDIEAKKQALKVKKGEIEALDTEIKKEFAATEQKLKAAKLPDEILQRHYKFVKHYEDNLAELKGNLDAVEKAKDQKQAEADIEKAKKHLERVKAPSHHQPLDPNNLPHRQPKVKKREPRLKKEEFERDFGKGKRADLQKPIMVASVGSLAGLLVPSSATIANLPTAADLAETVEVQFTPEIRAKAQELGNNPVKIYEWVRNNIEFVPTYGSIQGAQMTLLTKQGNAFDTASLLIALLRASGIHARYVYGTIELPIDKVMNWAGGFTDPMAALEFMASGGIPIKAGISGGKITKAQLEHVWVEAWVDMVPSFGAVHKQGDTWIPLDAAFKQYAYTNGIDLKSALPFDAQGFVDQLKSSATINEADGSVTNVDANLIQANLLNFQSQLQGYVNLVKPNATFGDIVGKKSIVIKNYSVLSESMPYKTIVKAWKSPELPDSVRHKITFVISANEGTSPEFTITKSLPEIAGKKITLSYAPAASSDTQLLLSYVDSGSTSLPAYLINLKPEFRIEGQVVASGDSVTMGQIQRFDMTMTAPTLNTNIISNKLTAGTYSAIVLDLGTIAAAQLDESAARATAAKAKLEANNVSGITKDDIMGEFLHGAGLGYWGMVDLTNKIAASLNGVADTRLPSEGIFTYDLSTGYAFGVPISATPTGFTTDIDADNHVVCGRNGDNALSVSYMALIGMLASKMEAGIYDLTFNKAFTGRGVSTAHILEYANQQGIPIYTVNASNVNTVLPQLQIDSEVKTDIQNAVASGKTVTIPKTNITKDGWRGTGYLVFDSTTGGGAYRISGGLSGGGYACNCFGFNPVVEFIINCFLAFLGISSLVNPVMLASISVLVSAISTYSTVCSLNEMNLTDNQRGSLIGLMVGMFIISAVIAGLLIYFTGPFAWVIFPLYWSIISIAVSGIVTLIGELLVNMNNNSYNYKRRKYVYIA